MTKTMTKTEFFKQALANGYTVSQVKQLWAGEVVKFTSTAGESTYWESVARRCNEHERAFGSIA